MTETITYSAAHWVDLYGFTSVFAKKRTLINGPEGLAFSVTKMCHQLSHRTPVRVGIATGDKEMQRFIVAQPFELAGVTVPQGEGLSVVRKFIVGTTSGCLRHASILAFDGAALGMILSPAWSIMQGQFLAGDVDISPKDLLLAPVPSDDVKYCVNISEFMSAA
ncbi:MAG: hypothetical protein B7X55_08485 [Rhodobacterales bacterium 34-62-10]|nr:MAG: hypothetical protein B7X55_08485 [Rhodobacterales bacterium 34-62-10]